MPTYQEVTGRVRAMIGDLPNHYADDNYLLTYVNIAQGQLVSELTASGVREAMFRTSMLVPAGTSRIERWPAGPTLPNEITYSDTFQIASIPSGWASIVGAAPTRSTGIADPDGGTGAVRWSFAADSTRTFYAAGAVVAPALSYFGSGSVWLKAAAGATTFPYRLTLRVGIADSTGPISETMVSREIAVTNEWQRVFLGYQGATITAAPTGDLRRCLEITLVGDSPIAIDLYRAVIRPGYADTEDVQTTGTPSVAGRIPVLPGGLLVPDKLLERSPGANAQWTIMRGPSVIADIRNSSRLMSWDWRNGGIDLNPCSADRELAIEYWGAMQDSVLGVNVLEEELPITGSLEPLAAITAGLVSQSRDQHGAAERFGIMKEEGGFTGAAGGLVMNLTTTFRKAQQSEPVRRQPYFGFSRYPGVSGNVIGAWPWNSN